MIVPDNCHYSHLWELHHLKDHLYKIEFQAQTDSNLLQIFGFSAKMLHIRKIEEKVKPSV